MKYQPLIDKAAANELTFIAYEGLGIGKGTAKDKVFHPHGRLNARISVYKGNKKVFTTRYASTIPDSISSAQAYKYNSGSPVPTTIEGMYPLYTTLHGKYKHQAFELGRLQETVPVIRGSNIDKSSYINVHYCKLNDPNTYAQSTGCVIMLESEIKRLIKILGITNFNHVRVGNIIIDRSNLHKELIPVYKKYYGANFSKFSSCDKGITELELSFSKTKELPTILETLSVYNDLDLLIADQTATLSKTRAIMTKVETMVNKY